MKSLIRWGDKLEDKIRHRLSRQPITYALIGGAGVVLFYRGIWHWADYLFYELFFISPAWDGPLTVIVSLIILLPTGLFVSTFIGNHIIISGIKGEKKLTEKTQQELQEEGATIHTIKDTVNRLAQDIQEIKTRLDEKNH